MLGDILLSLLVVGLRLFELLFSLGRVSGHLRSGLLKLITLGLKLSHLLLDRFGGVLGLLAAQVKLAVI